MSITRYITRVIPFPVGINDEAAIGKDLSSIGNCPPEISDFHWDFTSLQILQQQSQSARE